MWHVLLFLPCLLFAQTESMLFQANAITQKYNLEVAKLPPPSPSPRPLNNTASVWLSIDLKELNAPAFEMLKHEKLWDYLRELGVRGVHLQDLKQGGEFRTAIAVDPKWGNWEELSFVLQKKGITLIGDAIGNATGLNADFEMALKNVADYPGLYHLVEIENRDWKCLPNGANALFVNVPWLTLQELQKKGYVPEQFAPYVKESSWNATGPISCIDGQKRRYIYLQTAGLDPVLNWLNPSFGAFRIATADILDSIYQVGEKIVCIDNMTSQETLSLWTRKLGGFSALDIQSGLFEYKQAKTDLIFDNLTPTALLHALIAEDAEILKLTYRLLLEEGIEIKRLVHVLQPFNQNRCDYALFLAEPKKRFQYYEEIITAEALRQRLLKEDAERLQGPNPVTWPSLCLAQLSNERTKMMDAHLLLSFFYAMQPGTFSFSVSDLLGLTAKEPVDLLSSNESSLYGSLPTQMQNSCSFAMRLRKVLALRRDSGIEGAELIAVPNTTQRGLLVLIFKLQNSQMMQMLAINFSHHPAAQIFENPAISQTSAIDLFTGLDEKKPLNSSSYRLVLPPLSAKAILFQTKYYN